MRLEVLWRSLKTAQAQSGSRRRIFLIRRVLFVKSQTQECDAREDDGLALPFAVTLANDTLGNVWLAGGAMVSRLQTNSADTYVSARAKPSRNIQRVLDLAGKPDGSLWVGFGACRKRAAGCETRAGNVETIHHSGVRWQYARVTALLLDRDSSLWIGTLNRGILPHSRNMVDHFRGSDGLSGDAVSGLFQDREGISGL